MNEALWLLLPAFFIVSVLYASVGHGGASGYLAVMALLGVSAVVMKPTALTLNLVVSFMGTVLFFRAGFFAWRLFWPFAVVSVPFAFLGGRLYLPVELFRFSVAAALLFAIARLLLRLGEGGTVRQPPVWAVVVSGASIGFFSGLIGVGGGIFLTPLLLMFGWANMKTAAAVSAPFIFVNSAAALLGHPNVGETLIEGWAVCAIAVILGGFAGARWGSAVASPAHLRLGLAVVLGLAVLKLVIM